MCVREINSFKIGAGFYFIEQSSGSRARTKKERKKLTSVTMDPLDTSLPFYENKCTSLMAAPIQGKVLGSGGGLPGKVQRRFM